MNTDEIRQSVRNLPRPLGDLAKILANRLYDTLDEIDRLEKVWEDTDDRAQGLEAEVVRLRVELKECREGLRDIEKGCSFPEDDVQRAIRDRARILLKGQDPVKE